MKISKRETIIGILTLFTVLFVLTYWFGSPMIEKQKWMKDEKARLEHQIKLNRKMIAEQHKWTGRLQELQAQLPVYDQRASVKGDILKLIQNMARDNGLTLKGSRSDREKSVGDLQEMSVICDWEGELDALVHFLYAIHEKGLRFDVEEISVRPDAKRAGMLGGKLIIDCAFRRSTSDES